jgi:hypothetical protein
MVLEITCPLNQDAWIYVEMITERERNPVRPLELRQIYFVVSVTGLNNRNTGYYDADGNKTYLCWSQEYFLLQTNAYSVLLIALSK